MSKATKGKEVEAAMSVFKEMMTKQGSLHEAIERYYNDSGIMPDEDDIDEVIDIIHNITKELKR